MSLHRLLALACLLLLAACSSKDGRSEGSKRRLEELARMYQSGKLEEAAIRLQEFVKAEPKDEVGWVLLGHVLLDQGKLQEAGAAYAKALQLDPRSVQALTGQGMLARRLGEYDKAMGFYEQAVAIDPSHAHAYSSMTTIALKKGQFDKAVTHAEKGYALDKTDPTIAANLAIAYHYAGNIEKRDALAKVAEQLGYKGMDKVRSIFSGELDVRD